MSLIHLLSVGQTLEGTESRPGGYNFKSCNTLPKFAPGSRRVPVEAAVPRSRATQPALVREPAASGAGNLVAPVLTSRRGMQEMPERQVSPATNAGFVAPVRTVRPPVVGSASVARASMIARPAAAPVSSHVTAPSLSQLQARPITPIHAKKGLMSKIKDMLLGRRAPTPSQGVQTELALEKITVMRNDLTETDLEVVAPKGSTVASVEKTSMVAPQQKARLRASQKASGKSVKSWFRSTASLLSPTRSAFQAKPTPGLPEQTPDLISRA